MIEWKNIFCSICSFCCFLWKKMCRFKICLLVWFGPSLIQRILKWNKHFVVLVYLHLQSSFVLILWIQFLKRIETLRTGLKNFIQINFFHWNFKLVVWLKQIFEYSTKMLPIKRLFDLCTWVKRVNFCDENFTPQNTLWSAK